VEAIDRALVAGEPAEKIARYRSLSPAAVKRHRSEHLPKALAQAQEARDAARADDLLSEARRLKEVTMALLGRAVQANDLRTALLAVREARGNLELIGKLLGELDSGPAVNVLLAPEWVSVRTTLLAALGPYPEARAAAAAQLMALESSNGHR
jgi:hypothetical protein